MGVYSELIRIIFKRQYIYRGNTIALIIGNVLSIFIQVSIWTTLIGEGNTVSGVTLKDMISFLIISMLVRTLTRSSISYTIANKIETGNVVFDFTRPVNPKYYILYSQFAENCYRIIFGTAPACIAAVMLFGSRIPVDFFNIAMFIISLMLAVILMFYIDYILGLLSYWLKNGLYVSFVRSALFEIFSGVSVPLWFYPDLLYNITRYLPFRYVAFEPISILLGKADQNAVLEILIIQAIWVAMLILLEKVVWGSAKKVVTVHGG